MLSCYWGLSKLSANAIMLLGINLGLISIYSTVEPYYFQRCAQMHPEEIFFFVVAQRLCSFTALLQCDTLGMRCATVQWSVFSRPPSYWKPGQRAGGLPFHHHRPLSERAFTRLTPLKASQ